MSIMRGMSEAHGSFDTLVSLHSTRLTKKFLLRARTLKVRFYLQNRHY